MRADINWDGLQYTKTLCPYTLYNEFVVFQELKVDLNHFYQHEFKNKNYRCLGTLHQILGKKNTQLGLQIVDKLEYITVLSN